jgi:hypothetical protein
MITRLQGDIWTAWRELSPNVLLLFGHDGFSGLSAKLLNHELPNRIKLPEKASDESDGVPQQLGADQWLIAHIDYEPTLGGRGLSDETFRHLFEEAYKFCSRSKYGRLMTNGIQDVSLPRQVTNDRRARLMYSMASQKNEIDTTFVSLSDIFIRNVP